VKLRAGVLVKVEKPGQEPRADRPDDRVCERSCWRRENRIAGGSRSRPNATIVLDRDEVIRAADQAGLFLVGTGRS